LEYNNLIANEFIDIVSELLIVGGNRANIRDGDEPFPVRARGVYFDGVDDYQIIEELVLTHIFNIGIWIFAYD
jgi:hypothetical protein